MVEKLYFKNALTYPKKNSKTILFRCLFLKGEISFFLFRKLCTVNDVLTRSKIKHPGKVLEFRKMHCVAYKIVFY